MAFVVAPHEKVSFLVLPNFSTVFHKVKKFSEI